MHSVRCISSPRRRPFYEKRMSAEIAADHLGEEWKVFVCPLNEKQHVAPWCGVYCICVTWRKAIELGLFPLYCRATCFA